MDGPRMARPEELPAIIELAEHVFSAEFGRPTAMVRSFPYMFSEANIDNLYVTYERDNPVSFIGTDRQDYVACGCRIPVACLGAVCTHKDYRRRGLASTLLELAYRRSRRKGCLIVTISGGIDLYYRTGAAGGVFAMLHWQADTETFAAADDSSLAIEPLSEANLPEMIALNAAEPFHFDWRDDWVRVVALGRHTGDMGRGYVIRRGDQPLAAACLDGPDPKTGAANLSDWFGDRGAVIAVMGRMLKDMGATLVRSRVVRQDEQMLEALRRAGVQPECKIPWPWPIKVLDFAGLLQALRPHLESTLGNLAEAIQPTERGISIQVGDTAYEAPDEATAVQMIFAVPEVYQERIADCPQPVRGVLRRAFPIPVRHYGLNFI